jgi:hypothetical protein
MVGLGRGAAGFSFSDNSVAGAPEATSEPDFVAEEGALRFFHGLFGGIAVAAGWGMANGE